MDVIVTGGNVPRVTQYDVSPQSELLGYHNSDIHMKSRSTVLHTENGSSVRQLRTPPISERRAKNDVI